MKCILKFTEYFYSVYLQGTQVETMLLMDEERLKNNLHIPSNIVASEETNKCMADTRATRTVSNQDSRVNSFSDTVYIKNSPKECSLGFVLTGKSIFLHEEIKKIFK